MANQVRASRQRRIPTALAGLGIAVALTVVPGTGTATAAGPAAPAAATTYKTHITQADSAIARAVNRVHAHQYSRAKTALATARSHIKQANAGAMALIGAPPADPESDELPGPPAVLAVLKLDNRVVTKVVPLFNGMDRPGVLDALRSTLGVTQNRRVTVLTKVLALPPEGDGDDYADGMADTLPMYSHEVAVVAGGLQTFRLTPSGKDGLTATLRRARDAEAKMNAAYGGGERPAAQG
jgi:hypothetical protein